MILPRTSSDIPRVTVLKCNAVARWVIASSLFVAGSCAPVSQGPLAGPHTPYDTVTAEKTLVFGFTSILERHLEGVSAAAIALEGMRGLGGLDAQVGISHLDGKVLLNAADRVVAEYPAPAENDIQGWARLTLTVVMDARGFSKAVEEADLETIYETVFDATLAKLDMFSRYSGAADARNLRASRNGFGGLGIRFDMVADEAKIVDVMEGTPAGRAGILAGDLLTHIEGQSISGLPKDEISKRLRGPVASSVTVTLRRGYKPLEMSIARALIVPPTVTMALNDGVAEFKITGFNQRTASSLANELKRASDQAGGQLKGVVLDMRGNPGGLLDQAVLMADLFIENGPIVSTRGRHPLATQHYEARQGDAGENLPVVVLVDGKSASAAEILAAALQDAGRAVVVGTNSYGKGTVQTVIRLPNDGEMTLTWSRFHTPTGYALHGLGVLPTICTASGAETFPAGLDGRAEGMILPAVLPASTSENLALWRHAKLEETDLRQQLRSTCPSARHDGQTNDNAMAYRILGDHSLYTQMLRVSSPFAITAPSQPAPVWTPQQVQH